LPPPDAARILTGPRTHTTHPVVAMSDSQAWQVVEGKVVEVEETYTREAPVSWPLLIALLLPAAMTRLLLLVLALVIRSGAGGGRRSFKELRRGPEIRVTPIWVGTGSAPPTELEVLGYLTGNAVIRTDRVRVRALPQRRAELPPRAVHIENLTTGRALTPRPTSLAAHLGPALILQAVCGLPLVAFAAACVVVALRG
jgi:hypothetical protein